MPLEGHLNRSSIYYHLFDFDKQYLYLPTSTLIYGKHKCYIANNYPFDDKVGYCYNIPIAKFIYNDHIIYYFSICSNKTKQT